LEEHVMPAEFPPSPVPLDADPWPGELPFTAFGQFGVDHIDLRVFDQDVYWVDRFGVGHRIDEMPDDYRANVVAFLVERVERFHTATYLRLAIQAAGDALLGRVSGEVLAAEIGAPRIVELDACVWLESTPLMRRLRR
jgi:hypothetical protein